jgi:hypothetical protein
MSPAIIGALRALLSVVIMAVVTWLANSANLQGVIAPALGTIVSMIALAIEHSMATGTTTALFGTVSTRRLQ